MPRRNAFYMFMEERRPSVLQTGIVLTGGRAQLSKMLSGEWATLPKKEKDRYAELARKFNEKSGKEKTAPQTRPEPVAQEPVEVEGGATQVETPRGMVNPYVLAAKLRLEEIQRNYRKYVLDLFKSEWVTHPIVVCSFNTYFNPNYEHVYFPAEVGLATFTLKDGVIDNFGRVIDPGYPPLGYGVEVARSIEKLGLPHPGITDDFTDLEALMQILESYLDKYRGQFPSGALYVFALDDDFELVTRCFEWLNKETERDLPIRVLSLSLYAYLASTYKEMNIELEEPSSLYASISLHRQAEKALNDCFTYSSTHLMTKYGVFNGEREVTELLKSSDNYKYYDELCCVYHFKKQDGAPLCALNVSNRHAYYILEILTLSNEIEIIPGGHYPELKERQTELARRHGWISTWGTTQMEVDLDDPPSLEVKVAHVRPLGRSRLSRREVIDPIPVDPSSGIEEFEEPADPNEGGQGGYRRRGSGSVPPWFRHQPPCQPSGLLPPYSELGSSQPSTTGSPPPWSMNATFMPLPTSPDSSQPWAMHGLARAMPQTSPPWSRHGSSMPSPTNPGYQALWPRYGPSQQLPPRAGSPPVGFRHGHTQPLLTHDRAPGQGPFHAELGAAVIPGIVPLVRVPTYVANPYQGAPPDVYVNPPGHASNGQSNERGQF